MLIGIFTQVWFWVNSLNTHLPHQSGYVLVIDDNLVSNELLGHPADAVVGQLGIDFVNFCHHQKIVWVNRNRLVIHACACNTQEVRLCCDWYTFLFVNVRQNDLSNRLVSRLRCPSFFSTSQPGFVICQPAHTIVV